LLVIDLEVGELLDEVSLLFLVLLVALLTQLVQLVKLLVLQLQLGYCLRQFLILLEKPSSILSYF
jgi:hypothetical protein